MTSQPAEADGHLLSHPVRVLHVSQPIEAGVAAVVAGIVDHQWRIGWQPSVACPPAGWLPQEIHRIGAALHPWTAGRSPGPHVMGEVRSLARIIARAAPDVVHLHSAKAGLAGRLAIRGTRPTIYQPHAWSFNAANGMVATASRFWERSAERWTHRLVCVSDDELRAGREVGNGAPAVVIANGVDMRRWRPGDRSAARARLAVPPEARLVTCVGRITEQKGQDLMLQAWSSITDAVPHALLALVGDGPRAPEWRSRYADRTVRWVGQADPLDWYVAADVVVMPSRWEGMALMPLEAMACERPVVAFEVSGARESIGDAGCVVPVGDLDALATALCSRLTDPGQAAEEGRRGRERVRAEFNRDESTRRTALLTQQLAFGDLSSR